MYHNYAIMLFVDNGIQLGVCWRAFWYANTVFGDDPLSVCDLDRSVRNQVGRCYLICKEKQNTTNTITMSMIDHFIFEGN